MGVDPLADKFNSWSPYHYATNNPINIIDYDGRDTLRAVDAVSGQRALGLIRGSFPSPSSASSLFSLGSDGVTFNSIDQGALNSAIANLSPEQQALATGYAQLINEGHTNIVEVINGGDNISSYGRDQLSGALKGSDTSGGESRGAGYDGSLVKVGNQGTYGLVILNVTDPNLYSDGVNRPPLPGETLAHEMLGHGLGNRNGRSDGQQLNASIQAGNLYLRSQGHSYYRANHGISNHTLPFMKSQSKYANKIPNYLSWKRFF